MLPKATDEIGCSEKLAENMAADKGGREFGREWVMGTPFAPIGV